MEPLSIQQQQVLTILAAGETMKDAAEAVGVHRNTIANWRRGSEAFRYAWEVVRYEQTMHWRDEMQSLANIAVQTIMKTMLDEHTPPSVRLRAALAVQKLVASPAPPQPDMSWVPQPAADIVETENDAQFRTTAPDPAVPPVRKPDLHPYSRRLFRNVELLVDLPQDISAYLIQQAAGRDRNLTQ